MCYVSPTKDREDRLTLPKEEAASSTAGGAPEQPLLFVFDPMTREHRGGEGEGPRYRGRGLCMHLIAPWYVTKASHLVILYGPSL